VKSYRGWCQSVYDDLMRKAVDRGIRRPMGRGKRMPSGYERHHIKPACLFDGGRRNPNCNASTNLVCLTHREHFLAHWLLTKIYPGNKSLLFALGIMRSRGVSSWRFAIARRAHVDAMTGTSWNLGRKHPPMPNDILMKISLAKKGKPSSLRGRKLSEATRSKISKAKMGNSNCLGRKASEETRRRISVARMGMVFSDEHRRNIGLASKASGHHKRVWSEGGALRVLFSKPTHKSQFILDNIISLGGESSTSELVCATGLSRKVIVDRLKPLRRLGLVVDSGKSISPAGKRWRENIWRVVIENSEEGLN
jgi:hypothetical protein